MEGKRWVMSLVFGVICHGCLGGTTTKNLKEKPQKINHSTPLPDQMNCKCANRTITQLPSTSPASSCDSYATQRGGNQSVVSYAFFGDVRSPYFKGIALNAELVTKRYPDWLMRVYHNLDIKNDSVRAQLCPLWCQYHHLDFCPIENLPAPLFNQSNVNPRVWRYNVLGDPLVVRFMSRDLDSLIGDREVAAVKEWLKSGRTWHFMHDHPYHYVVLLAGMWGGHNKNLTLTTNIRRRLIDAATNQTHFSTDQNILGSIVGPIAESDGDYVNHNSYACGISMKRSRPFPVQRKSPDDWVGVMILRESGKYFSIKIPCPERCRPPAHKDWIYC